jgi:hypothetical protein
MHVGLIIDRERLLHEAPTLDRLTVALLDEGVQVTRFLPQPSDLQEQSLPDPPAPGVAQIPVPMDVPVWLQRFRARQLASTVGRSSPDVLYAMGSAAWTIAVQLGPLLERPAVLDLWSADQVRAVPRRRGAQHVAAYVTPTEPICHALQERLNDPAMVALVRPGVALPSEQRTILEHAESSVCLAIIGGGRSFMPPSSCEGDTATTSGGRRSG